MSDQYRVAVDALNKRIVAISMLPPLATGSRCIACREIWPLIDQQGYCSWCQSAVVETFGQDGET